MFQLKIQLKKTDTMLNTKELGELELDTTS